MKKLLQIMCSFSIVTSAAYNVISCGKNNQWKEFQSIVNDKKGSYLIMLDGADATESKTMHTQLWNPVSANPSTALYSYNYSTKGLGPLIDSDPNSTWNNYVNNSVQPYAPFTSKIPPLADAKVKFINLEGKVASKLWEEDWAKWIMEWCGKESWNVTTNNNGLYNKDYVNRYKTKFEIQKPLFIYIDHGYYHGIHTYDDPNLLSSSTNCLTAKTFYDWSYQIFIGHSNYGADQLNP